MMIKKTLAQRASSSGIVKHIVETEFLQVRKKYPMNKAELEQVYSNLASKHSAHKSKAESKDAFKQSHLHFNGVSFDLVMNQACKETGKNQDAVYMSGNIAAIADGVTANNLLGRLSKEDHLSYIYWTRVLAKTLTRSLTKVLQKFTDNGRLKLDYPDFTALIKDSVTTTCHKIPTFKTKQGRNTSPSTNFGCLINNPEHGVISVVFGDLVKFVDGKITDYGKNQGIKQHGKQVSRIFHIKEKDLSIELHSPQEFIALSTDGLSGFPGPTDPDDTSCILFAKSANPVMTFFKCDPTIQFRENQLLPLRVTRVNQDNIHVQTPIGNGIYRTYHSRSFTENESLLGVPFTIKPHKTDKEKKYVIFNNRLPLYKTIPKGTPFTIHVTEGKIDFPYTVIEDGKKVTSHSVNLPREIDGTVTVKWFDQIKGHAPVDTRFTSPGHKLNVTVSGHSVNLSSPIFILDGRRSEYLPKTFEISCLNPASKSVQLDIKVFRPNGKLIFVPSSIQFVRSTAPIKLDLNSDRLLKLRAPIFYGDTPFYSGQTFPLQCCDQIDQGLKAVSVRLVDGKWYPANTKFIAPYASKNWFDVPTEKDQFKIDHKSNEIVLTQPVAILTDEGYIPLPMPKTIPHSSQHPEFYKDFYISSTTMEWVAFKSPPPLVAAPSVKKTGTLDRPGTIVKKPPRETPSTSLNSPSSISPTSFSERKIPSTSPTSPSSISPTSFSERKTPSTSPTSSPHSTSSTSFSERKTPKSSTPVLSSSDGPQVNQHPKEVSASTKKSNPAWKQLTFIKSTKPWVVGLSKVDLKSIEDGKKAIFLYRDEESSHNAYIGYAAIKKGYTYTFKDGTKLNYTAIKATSLVFSVEQFEQLLEESETMGFIKREPQEK
ncbi:hypothetical protein DID78_03470 [Candidatus Marinamargulisbacteria bacterium SCGC AG-343-D04]|nr:hypothetical protein DID78_03470 [Candidatus Marinamargulisbacteria bacterium SCGC AG-343-D04]